MHLLKSIAVLFILFCAVSSFSADSFKFSADNCTAHLEAGHIWFEDNVTNEKIGPELYADDTNAEFFTLIKNLINDAITNNKKIKLEFTNIDSQNHGQYDCIIPES